jgi:hypothetical protein
MERLARIAGCAALLSLVLTLPACDFFGSDEELPDSAGGHPLAKVLLDVRPGLSGLDASELAAIDTFIRQAGPRTSTVEVRRICGLAGKGLKASEPKAVADFILASKESLYDDFFRNLDEVALVRVSDLLRERPGIGDVERLRYGAIIGSGRGVYKGTLARALKVVSFGDAVKPIALARADLDPSAEDPVAVWQGSAEILRMQGFVLEGPSVELAVATYHRALDRWPNDPVLLTGLAALYVEYKDKYADELLSFLRQAHHKDSRNAAYSYLLAACHFRFGRDDKALAALRSGRNRPLCTLHTIERARRISSRLQAAEYGRMRAMLSAYQMTSMAPLFDVKDLANRAVLRSREYQVEKRTEDLETVLRFPEILSRQVSAGPRTRHAELLRVQILATGLSRRANWVVKTDAAGAERLRIESVEAERRAMRIEKGEELCGRKRAWGKLYDLLGQEKFLVYVEHVLYGNEAEFLVKCSDLEGLEDVVDLATAEYPF